jgi:hypothetical protein
VREFSRLIFVEPPTLSIETFPACRLTNGQPLYCKALEDT